ncbi:DinB family protein [Fictibacillus phosphorivorans]|uniref:DinB family protein n=1 Tax=Fictibacillus phosphorivorans TaxID=1221500 RepID=UPI00203B31F1|nr:DinB family protein [Fictibacillus phosphorivorans]MCM3719033.1 DinB family protein [Fictibacillus phosphorivorans]MCM3776655.1 DinB family protein [Fictibacillus phosphorivorans]
MNELTFKNFELARSFFLKHLGELDKEVAQVQPEGFNNNIHWHVGHVLTIAEYFMFGYPEKTKHLPLNYIELFNRGTSPADWKGEVPSLSELTEQLKDQMARIKEIPEERLQEKLEKPLFNFTTFGELMNFAVFHETYHLGQMHAMKKVIEQSKVQQG